MACRCCNRCCCGSINRCCTCVSPFDRCGNLHIPSNSTFTTITPLNPTSINTTPNIVYRDIDHTRVESIDENRNIEE